MHHYLNAYRIIGDIIPTKFARNIFVRETLSLMILKSFILFIIVLEEDTLKCYKKIVIYTLF